MNFVLRDALNLLVITERETFEGFAVQDVERVWKRVDVLQRVDLLLLLVLLLKQEWKQKAVQLRLLLLNLSGSDDNGVGNELSRGDDHRRIVEDGRVDFASAEGDWQDGRLSVVDGRHVSRSSCFILGHGRSSDLRLLLIVLRLLLNAQKWIISGLLRLLLESDVAEEQLGQQNVRQRCIIAQALRLNRGNDGICIVDGAGDDMRERSFAATNCRRREYYARRWRLAQEVLSDFRQSIAVDCGFLLENDGRRNAVVAHVRRILLRPQNLGAESRSDDLLVLGVAAVHNRNCDFSRDVMSHGDCSVVLRKVSWVDFGSRESSRASSGSTSAICRASAVAVCATSRRSISFLLTVIAESRAAGAGRCYGLAVAIAVVVLSSRTTKIRWPLSDSGRDVFVTESEQQTVVLGRAGGWLDLGFGNVRRPVTIT